MDVNPTGFFFLREAQAVEQKNHDDGLGSIDPRPSRKLRPSHYIQEICLLRIEVISNVDNVATSIRN